MIGRARTRSRPAWKRLNDVNSAAIRWVGVAIDCADAKPVAHFYERLLGFEVGDFEPPHRAQLWDPSGGVHLNIQGEAWYQPPTRPERSGEQAKMVHFEVEVDDLDVAVAPRQLRTWPSEGFPPLPGSSSSRRTWSSHASCDIAPAVGLTGDEDDAGAAVVLGGVDAAP